MTTTNDHITVVLKAEIYLKVLLFNKVEDKRDKFPDSFISTALINVYPCYASLSFLNTLALIHRFLCFLNNDLSTGMTCCIQCKASRQQRTEAVQSFVSFEFKE